jgi:hypothetical protein
MSSLSRYTTSSGMTLLCSAFPAVLCLIFVKLAHGGQNPVTYLLTYKNMAEWQAPNSAEDVLSHFKLKSR